MSPIRKETTISERKVIMHLHSQGNSLAEIAQLLERSRYTIRSVVNRFKNCTILEDKHRTGRPRILTERESTAIVRKVKINPKRTSTDIAAEVLKDLKKNVSPRTIRRVLVSAGYKSRVARRKPYISVVNKRKRMEFANQYKNKPNSFWDKVVFSDESKFNIFQSDGRIRVWRKPNTELEKQNLVSTVKHGGGGVMVWGCMSSAGVGNLIFVDGIMDKRVYLNILKENLKNSAIKLGVGNDFYFQQDNDPKHTANDVKMWIIYNVPHTLDTPPQSPDLNPIEHLWDELERRLRKHHITNKNQLKTLISTEWANIGGEITKKLVHSMPNRLHEVIKQKGLPTRY